MTRQEAIELLEQAVQAEQLEQGADLANAIEKLTTVYPYNWTPYKDGIRWQGFYIRRLFGMFSAPDGEIAASVQVTRTQRHWWGGTYTVTEHSNRRITNAATMLNVLKNNEPWEYRNG